MPNSEMDRRYLVTPEAKDTLVYSLRGVELGIVLSALQTEPLVNSDAYQYSIDKFPSLGLEADYRTTPRHDLHWREDIQAAAEIANRFRFTIDWSRWCPTNPNQYDKNAIKQDLEKIKYARSLGLKVDLCFNHFACPAWIINYDGWLENQVPWLFEHFVEKILEELGPYLDPDTRFNIFNEPATRITMELGDKLPPSKIDYLDHPASFNRRIIDMFSMVGKIQLAIRRAKHTINRYNHRHQTNFSYYSASQYTPIRPGNANRIVDRAAAKLADHLQNFVPLDAVVSPEDEFVAVTYYHIVTVSASRWNGNHCVIDESLDGSSSDYHLGPFLVNGSNLGDQEMKSRNGWPFVPVGLMNVLETIHRFYPDKKIVLAENGFPGVFQESGNPHEDALARCVHLLSHLIIISKARQMGIPVVEADIWSLIDNNEFGRLRDRFGLLAVDYDDHLKRTPRPTYFIMREIKRSQEINLPQIYDMLMNTCGFSESDINRIHLKVRQVL